MLELLRSIVYGNAIRPTVYKTCKLRHSWSKMFYRRKTVSVGITKNAFQNTIEKSQLELRCGPNGDMRYEPSGLLKNLEGTRGVDKRANTFKKSLSG